MFWKSGSKTLFFYSFGGREGFQKVREAEGMNVLRISSKSDLMAPIHDKKQRLTTKQVQRLGAMHGRGRYKEQVRNAGLYLMFEGVCSRKFFVP